MVGLGFHIGIGGALLQNEAADGLEEAVRAIPLDRILVETDAPFVLPDLPAFGLSKKQKRKIRNTPLILPEVIRRIAELKGLEPSFVEETVFRNTVSLFRLEGAYAPADGGGAPPGGKGKEVRT